MDGLPYNFELYCLAWEKLGKEQRLNYLVGGQKTNSISSIFLFSWLFWNSHPVVWLVKWEVRACLMRVCVVRERASINERGQRARSTLYGTLPKVPAIAGIPFTKPNTMIPKGPLQK